MRFRALYLLPLLARFASAQSLDTSHRAPAATITGIVHDSITRVPLAGAVVQLVAADNPAHFGGTATSDSLGRFTLGAVPAGRYMLGFFHPMLDSLGLEPTLREVNVDGSRPVRADLATPSPARLRAAICGARSLTPGAVVVGVVRDAQDGTPAAGARVTGEWVELSIGKQGIDRRVQRLVATTMDNGWFAICDLPSDGMVALKASRGADTTDLIEVPIPAEGFLRRELYLGAARTVLVHDSATRADKLAPPPRRVHTGDGHLSGTVVTVSGQPVAGALVAITDGPQTHVNERGEWAITDAPAGSRMLEVRGLGYYPALISVDIVGVVAPIRVALSTLAAVLDTVMVRGARVSDSDQDGFLLRKRSGAGHYLLSKDIERFQPANTSDIFHVVPGLKEQFDDGALNKTIQMRGPVDTWCDPVFYLDGRYMGGLVSGGLTADDIDTWVRPHDIAGIEVYSEASAPPQFSPGMNGCGSIVIWTKGTQSGRAGSRRPSSH